MKHTFHPHYGNFAERKFSWIIEVYRIQEFFTFQIIQQREKVRELEYTGYIYSHIYVPSWYLLILYISFFFCLNSTSIELTQLAIIQESKNLHESK